MIVDAKRGDIIQLLDVFVFQFEVLFDAFLPCRRTRLRSWRSILPNKANLPTCPAEVIDSKICTQRRVFVRLTFTLSASQVNLIQATELVSQGQLVSSIFPSKVPDCACSCHLNVIHVHGKNALLPVTKLAFPSWCFLHAFSSETFLNGLSQSNPSRSCLYIFLSRRATGS